jgi:hypothetical protein
LVSSIGSRGDLANSKMLAFTDGTCVYITLLPLGFIFDELIAKRIHV